MKVVEVKELVKDYGNFRALRGISFEVNEGEIFGLVGPNDARVAREKWSGDFGASKLAGIKATFLSTKLLEVRGWFGKFPITR